MARLVREVQFGAQVLVRGRDFERKRGSVLLLNHKTGAMACLECGERWRAAMRSGFYAGRVTCPRCGAGTRQKQLP